EQHRTAVGLDQTNDHIKRGRFARAVGAEQSDDLAGADFGADAVDHGPLAIALAQLAHLYFTRRKLHGHFITMRVNLMSEVNVLPVRTSRDPFCPAVMRTLPLPASMLVPRSYVRWSHVSVAPVLVCACTPPESVTCLVRSSTAACGACAV